MNLEQFLKSYATDFVDFKNRYLTAGLGSELEAKDAWRHILSGNPYMKYTTLKQIKEAGIKLNDLTTLGILVKCSLTIQNEKEKGK